MSSRNPALARLEEECRRCRVKWTHARRLILIVLLEANDHPTANDIHERARLRSPYIAIATIYRNIAILEGAGLIQRHQFGSDRARFELAGAEPHDHLIDLQTGEIVEFQDDAFDALKAEIARRLGYAFADARVEIYANPIDRTESRQT